MHLAISTDEPLPTTGQTGPGPSAAQTGIGDASDGARQPWTLSLSPLSPGLWGRLSSMRSSGTEGPRGSWSHSYPATLSAARTRVLLHKVAQVNQCVDANQ